MPATASLHVFVQIVMVFELGYAASLVKSYWLPLTRQLWSELFSYLSYLRFYPSDAEKDALTATAFFLPLAVSSAFLWLRDRNRGAPEEDVVSWSRIAVYRVMAFVASILILFFVSQQVIVDAWVVFYHSSRGVDIELLSSISIVLIGVVILSLIFFYRSSGRTKRVFFVFGASFGAFAELVIVGAPVVWASYYAAVELGLIRSAAILLVTSSILLAVSVRPSKVLQVAYFVAALVIAATVIDFLQTFMQSVDLEG